MNRTKKKRSQKEIQRISVFNVTFRLPEPKDGKIDKRKASYALIEYEKKVPGNTIFAEVKIPLVSVWRDPNTNNACKAYMLAPMKTQSRNIQIASFAKEILAQGYAECTDDMIISCDSSGMLRYGIKMRKSGTAAHYRRYDQSNFSEYFIYDSRNIAMAELIKEIGNIVPVGGIDQINLGLLPPSILQEAGFQYIPDLLRRGVGMWLGNPKFIFQFRHIKTWDRGKAQEDFARKLLININNTLQEREKVSEMDSEEDL